MEKFYSMPCLYGACFYYKNNSACAYVDNKGHSHLVSSKIKRQIITSNHALIRGLEYLIFGLYYFAVNLVKMPFVYSPKSLSKQISNSLNVSTRQVLLVFVLIFSVICSLFLIGFVPTKLAVLMVSFNKNIWLSRLVVGLTRVIIFFAVMILLKMFIPFKQFYRFNACCNLLLSDNKSIYKPTNFLNYIVTSFCINLFVLSIVGFTVDQIWKPALNLIISMFCFSISYEVLLLIENSKIKWIKNLCFLTSFLVTEKPTKTEIYIAMSAYNEVEFMQNKKRGIVNTEDFKETDVSFSAVYAEAKQKLKDAKIEDISELDWLICEVLGTKRGQLRLLTKISTSQKAEIDEALQKRINGEPITKIFGRTEFYGYEFKVTKDVLSPRMETEILVETALKYAKKKMNILDLCTGSGIIAISMAKNVEANFTAIDISEKALLVAQENAKNNNVKIAFKKSNLFDNLKKTKRFDIIVSNPPYIPTQDIESLDTEVKNYDPKIALDGGIDGLDFYKKIIQTSPQYLAVNGMLMLEIGFGQSKSITKLLEEDFESVKVIKDFNKIDRVIIAKLKDKKRK